MIDYESLAKISYGIYIVCSGNQEKGNGYISNTVFQVTAEPARFATCCNKNNYTAQLIQKHGVFTVSVLGQEASADLLGRFGYHSGSETDKLQGMNLRYGKSGAPIVLNDCIAYQEFKLSQTIDLGTHWMFLGDLIDSVTLDPTKESMTYAYYKKVKKLKAPKNAPTYVDDTLLKPKKMIEGARSYKCTVCGYIYEEAEEGIAFGDQPSDFVCPICGAGKEDFTEI